MKRVEECLSLMLKVVWLIFLPLRLTSLFSTHKCAFFAAVGRLGALQSVKNLIQPNEKVQMEPGITGKKRMNQICYCNKPSVTAPVHSVS